MNKKIAIFILILLHTCLFGQTRDFTIEGVVKSANGGEPIPYVSIALTEKRNGTYSNEEGLFKITLATNQTLAFSAIGFKSILLSYTDIIERDNIITLEEDVVKLDDVTILADKTKVKSSVEEFGYQDSEKKSRLVAKTPGFQIATRIENTKNKSGYVESILMNVVSTGKSRIRLHLYSIDNFPEQPKELLSKDMIVDIGKKKGIQRIDVTNEAIPFPLEGIVVGVEFLGNIKSDNQVILTNGLEIETKVFLSQADSQAGTYIGFMGKKFEKEFYSSIYKTTCNAMVGVLVRFYEE